MCHVMEEVFDDTKPWDYFDGVASGEPKRGGAGSILNFSKSHI